MTVVTLPAGQMASAIVRANRLFGFDANGQAALYDTAAATGAVPGAINVKLAPYNAKGDGATDDTDAIQAALNAAKVDLSANFYGPTRGAVYLPPGDYRHRGLDLSPRVSLCGEGRGSTSLTLRGGMNRSSVKVLAASLGDTAPTGDFNQALVRGLTIYGNSSNNTTGHGIEFVDPGYTSSTRYCTAGDVDDVDVVGAAEYGIWGATNRNYGRITKTRIRSCAVGGILITAYDWQVSVIDIGANGKGIVVSGGAVSINNGAIYSNNDHALQLYGNSWMTLEGLTFGSNAKTAILLDNTDGLPIHVANCRFSGNSQAGDGTYPIIQVTGSRAATFVGCEFLAQSASKKASHIVRHINAGSAGLYPVFMSSCWWPEISDTVGKPWKTAAFSNPEVILGAIPVETASGVWGTRLQGAMYPGPYANDAAAATAGVLVGRAYWNSSNAVVVRAS